MRHTAVYHMRREDLDFFLFVHPTKDSAFEQRLTSITKEDATSGGLLTQILEDPFRLHTTLLATYLDNWGAILKDFDETISLKVGVSSP